MRVVAGQAVVAAALVAQADAGTSRSVDVDQIERRAKVDEERIVALTREHLTPTGDRVDRRCDETRVVGRRLGADVVGWRQQVATERLDRLDLAVGPERDLADVICLNDVQVLVRAGGGVEGDGAAVVQEGVRVLDRRVELESIGDVFGAVTGVVDLDLVPDVVRETEEVRATGRLLKRDEVRDEGRGVGLVWADECVDVRVVRRRVLADTWRFAVAGAPRERRDHRRGSSRSQQGRDGKRLASGESHVHVLS